MKQYIDHQNDREMVKTPSSSYRFRQKVTEENFEMISVGKVDYDKKVIVIYNPNSGKGMDVKPKIKSMLNQLEINYEFYITEGAI